MMKHVKLFESFWNWKKKNNNMKTDTTNDDVEEVEMTLNDIKKEVLDNITYPTYTLKELIRLYKYMDDRDLIEKVDYFYTKNHIINHIINTRGEEFYSLMMGRIQFDPDYYNENEKEKKELKVLLLKVVSKSIDNIQDYNIIMKLSNFIDRGEEIEEL